MKAGAREQAPIRVIANAVECIDQLALGQPLSPSELAERLGVPRSSAYRLVEGLAATALVESLGDGRVRLSTRWLSLGDAARSAMSEWTGAAGVLSRLVERTGQTAFLTILVEDEAMCIDWRRGRGVDVLALRPGRSLPLYAGAAGRVLLAFLADSEAYLQNAPFRALTPRTLVDETVLRDDVARTRQQGWVRSQQDVSIGIDALGVPVRGADGVVKGCVSIGGLTDAFDSEFERFRAALSDAAEALATTQAGS